jgi:hypothetical protein
MHPYPQPSHADLNPQPSAHRGPLSRTWPQLFKKRRRYSPVRESAQQVQPQPQPQQAQVHGPVPIYAENAPVAAQALRIPSLVADTASTVSTLSQASTQPPPPKIPIARRTSSIATTESNGELETPCMIEASFLLPRPPVVSPDIWVTDDTS